MKRSELLNRIDRELLDRLFGFCYNRTAGSFEAEELCSDIVFALIKAAGKDGEVESPDAFIWRVAHHVYADYAAKRKREAARRYGEDPEVLFACLPAEEAEDGDSDRLQNIHHQIAFLTRAYREVMIRYYLDGHSVAQIAREQGVGENTIRQRLFSARETIRKEVAKLENNNKPTAFQQIDYVIWGTGNPGDGDPRDVCQRQLSNHVVWLCRNRQVSAREVAEALHVPMAYVEEELQIQCHGTNGRYGLLKKLDNGRYTTNFVLLDQQEIATLQKLYTNRIPMICDTVAAYIEAHREAYLAFPYLNRKVDMNLILWAQISSIAHTFSDLVESIMKEKGFADVPPSDRPFSVFGFRRFDDKFWGGGWDGANAYNLCGYKQVFLSNIYIGRIQAHFHCGHNIGGDRQLQLAIRAIDGIPVDSLSDVEKEVAAKAVQCGYLYREDDRLYTKFLVTTIEDQARMFQLNDGLKESFRQEAERMADILSAALRRYLPAHLLPDYRYANSLAAMPVLDTLVEDLIGRGLLVPPKNGIGAEGMWMGVEK